MYDRAPIVVTPNVCALPERGGRKFIGSSSSSNQGGLGYFHPHAKFQVNAVRVECDSVETVSPTIFSASVTVGNVNERGSVELFMKKRTGPIYDYDYEYDQYSSHDQQTQHAEHVVSSLLFDHSSDSSDLGLFYTPPPCIPTLPSSRSSSSSSLSIPHSSLCISSPRNEYNTSTATSSPNPTAGSSNNNTASHSDKHQDKKKTSVDVQVGGKKRWKNREYTQNRVEGECRTKRTMSRPDASNTFELEGCLGGF